MLICYFKYISMLCVMACNCKKNFNKMEKYSDDKPVSRNNKDKKISINKILLIVGSTFLTIFIGILAIVLFIVIGLPMLVYIIGANIAGKTPTLSLGKLINRKRTR